MDSVKLRSLHPDVVEITLNRPDRLNALTIEMMERLIKVLDEMREKRVLIIKGAGSSFCTGLDLDEAADPHIGERSAETIAELLKALYLSPAITIASVRGHALAGGFGIAAVSDFVIAEEGAQLGFPEVKRGLVASIVLSFLARQLCERSLKELFLFGDLIDAGRAKEMGLVNQIVPKGELDAQSEKRALGALSSAPIAARTLKRLIEKVYPHPLDHALNEALSQHKLARTHYESEEGIAAFREKRPPKWLN